MFTYILKKEVDTSKVLTREKILQYVQNEKISMPLLAKYADIPQATLYRYMNGNIISSKKYIDIFDSLLTIMGDEYTSIEI